ncbi:MAG: SRPBCC domain-containing protein [Chloroflexota bacterium]|nr:SRPBCC domain-containing protein [Chloroflexota bacterium]
MSILIAERKFVVEATPQRIWDLLLRATLRLMPFEKCYIESDTEFNAVLKLGMAFIKVPMQVNIKIVDMTPPQTMITALKAKGMGGLAWINQKSTFVLTQAGENKTEVLCRLEAEEMAPLLRLFFIPRVKSFAGDAYKNLEERLKQWA